MTESAHRLNDALVKWLTCFIGVCAFFIARNTYVAQQASLRAQAEREERARSDSHVKDAAQRDNEYRRYLWQRQLDLYIEASKAASTLAVVKPTDPEYSRARIRFYQLFFGDLCIVESPDVARAMVAFRNALEKGTGELLGLSIELARACRASTESAWGTQLGDITDISKKPGGA